MTATSPGHSCLVGTSTYAMGLSVNDHSTPWHPYSSLGLKEEAVKSRCESLMESFGCCGICTGRMCVLMGVCSSGYGMHLACYLRASPQILSPRVSLLAPFSRAVFMYFWSLDPFLIWNLQASEQPWVKQSRFQFWLLHASAVWTWSIYLYLSFLISRSGQTVYLTRSVFVRANGLRHVECFGALILHIDCFWLEGR